GKLAAGGVEEAKDGVEFGAEPAGDCVDGDALALLGGEGEAVGGEGFGGAVDCDGWGDFLGVIEGKRAGGARDGRKIVDHGELEAAAEGVEYVTAMGGGAGFLAASERRQIRMQPQRCRERGGNAGEETVAWLSLALRALCLWDLCALSVSSCLWCGIRGTWGS